MLGLEPAGPLAGTLPGKEPGEPGNPDVGTVGAKLGHSLTPVMVIFRDACLQSIGAFRGLATVNCPQL